MTIEEITVNMFKEQVTIAEVLRADLNALSNRDSSIAKIIAVSMEIGATCQRNDIRFCSITCSRIEFENRKNQGEI